MTTRYVQPGETLDYPNASGATINSNAVVVLTAGASGLIGVAQDTFETATTGAVGIAGVYELPAVTLDTGAIGAVVYWDAAAGKITTTAGANTRAGRLARAKINTDTVARVLLNKS